MGMFLLGALVAWFLVSFIEEYTHFCGVLEFPMTVMYVLWQILISPFMLFYLIFLRHTIKPVNLEAVEKANILEDSKHLFGSVYICFDKKAKRLCNKIFLFKVKPPVISNKADSPEFFRIGVDN
jgi:hypothetical protein